MPFKGKAPDKGRQKVRHFLRRQGRRRTPASEDIADQTSQARPAFTLQRVVISGEALMPGRVELQLDVQPRPVARRESEEALAPYFGTESFRAFAAALPSLLAAPPVMLWYDVANRRPLFGASAAQE